MVSRFFVYGSLLSDQPNHKILSPFVNEIRQAYVDGMTLYLVDLTYPGMVRGQGRVVGEVIELEPASLGQAMALLDDLEDYYGEGNPRNEYERIILEVTDASSGLRLTTWCYLWARGTAGLLPIPGGDWRSFQAN